MQAMGGIPAILAMALPVMYVGGGYFILTLDRQRANSISKDDTQAGLKLVLFGLMIAGVTLAAGGIDGLISFALGGFKGGSGPIKMALPPILVGGGTVAVVALAFLPRTNHATYRQAERYGLGLLAVYYGIQMISSLNLVVSGLFAGAPWQATSSPLASFLVGGALAVVSIIRFGSVSGWT